MDRYEPSIPVIKRTIPVQLLTRYLTRDLLHLLHGVIRLRVPLALLAPLEHKPCHETHDGQGGDDHADGNTGDGARAEAGGGVVVGLVRLGARAGGGKLELLRGDVEAGGLDVEVGDLDEGLSNVSLTACSVGMGA